MEVILDTNFILTCIKEKIDFLEAEKFGKLILPIQVIYELEKLAEKNKGKEKENAVLALSIIEKNKSKFKITDLGKKFTDAGIRKYVSSKRKVIVASLDAELKRELKDKARILTIRARKKLALD